MITQKSQFLQLTMSAITFLGMIGALSMIWPGIIALFLGAILLFQSITAEPEVVVLSWAEVGQVQIVVASLRRPDLPTIPSWRVRAARSSNELRSLRVSRGLNRFVTNRAENVAD